MINHLVSKSDIFKLCLLSKTPKDFSFTVINVELKLQMFYISAF